MKYSKGKTEAIKVLFAEILEVNEEFERAGSEKEIQFELDGGKFPMIIVRFWDWESDQKPAETFEISLDTYHERAGRRHDFSALLAKVRDWRERFGHYQEENGRAV